MLEQVLLDLLQFLHHIFVFVFLLFYRLLSLLLPVPLAAPTPCSGSLKHYRLEVGRRGRKRTRQALPTTTTTVDCFLWFEFTGYWLEG
jgi:hypothetical protein